MASNGNGGESFIHPMDQFVVGPIFGGHITPLSVTNSTIWMAISVLAICALTILGTRGRALVPSRVQSIAELLYGFVRQTLHEVAGDEGLKYFPYIFTLFTFILFCNMLGMLPYSFTPTSHIAVTGVMALAVFVSVTVIAFRKHGTHFLMFFWPMEAPGWLRPVLCVIELISYFVRPVSHSVRLGANMLAGHAVLKVFAGLFAMMIAGGLGALAILPLAGMIGLTALEFLVAFIQAYVFMILTCVYLNDALHMH
ncbi:F0F1 ATP synthase subunit A [Paralimibaculum aggregatum]|uniref:ATP synthase subunit a n=1 Tax=Paralimibaculum aggregatum TaxID=3036245 RepID=A0ABQ6LTP3_9RHOB|nr:F0F1 ATP synthase subunit A [Limibaculum sp. NKW23]GMG85465.1 F0F1 ATP synthase subunit A [Limibaculum sp. NKW23]